MPDGQTPMPQCDICGQTFQGFTDASTPDAAAQWQDVPLVCSGCAVGLLGVLVMEDMVF